ncbi:MAG: GDYXXLXY domain-containing protein [Acidobacteriota bacterium]
MARRIALVGLALVLVTVNVSILRTERHLAGGRIVYLELAPVDPRSLMQGDYMALRFEVGNQVVAALPKTDGRRRHDVDATDGHVVLRLDERQVGTFARLDDGSALAENEIRLRYRVRNGTVKFATNAFFFQEGHALLYEPARYGLFRVNDRGEPLLTTMHGEDLARLGPGD